MFAFRGVYAKWILFFINLCFILFVCSEVKYNESSSDQPFRIAIVGAGIGGAATAYFLHELAGNALIDVYESDTVGGRVATVHFADSYYEIGGTILHPSNDYMAHFVDKLGLSRSPDCPSSDGLYDGEQFVFRDSSWSIITLARLFWRYGFQLYHLNAFIEELLKKFSLLYVLQNRGVAFHNTTALLCAIEPRCTSMTQLSVREYMKTQNIAGPVVDELVMAASLCNYGQTPDQLHGFVGSVGVAGGTPKLWRVLGGNKQVAESLIARSHSALLRRKVTRITSITAPSASPLFQVASVEVSEQSTPCRDQESCDEREQEYDAVIVAAPLTSDTSEIKFTVSKPVDVSGSYKTIFATLVQGTLRPAAFNLAPTDNIDGILVTNPDLLYNAISVLTPVDGCTRADPPVYKVFSDEQLTKQQLDTYFFNIVDTKVVKWRAYPAYNSSHEALFELQPGLYHLNAVEWLASAMEMSAVAAKNVALLAVKYLTGDPTVGRRTGLKDEL